MKDIGRTFALDQPLKPGENAVWLTTNPDGTHDYSITTSPSDGVDATAVVDVQSAGGRVDTRVYFYVASFKSGTTTTKVSGVLPSSGDTAHYKGAIPKVASGRSARLRLMVVIPDGVTDAILKRGQVSGWSK